MAFKSLLASTLLGFAAAANEAPNVPVSGQIGAFSFGIVCNTPFVGTKTWAAYFSATAPIQGTTGSKIYYDDLIAYVTVPGSVTQYGGYVNGTQADADVKVALNLTNATPASLDVFPNAYQTRNVTFTAGKPVTVRVPVKGQVAPIGPVTLGKAGVAHSIHLGPINILLTINKADGSKAIGPLNVTCAAPSIPYDLGVVNILDSSAGTFNGNLSNNGQGKFASITNGFETGSFRFPYACGFTGIGNSDIDLSVTGSIPNYANTYQQFNITDAYGFLRGNSAFVAFLKNSHSGATSVKTTVSNYTIGVQNGIPSSLQVVKTPISSTSSLSGTDIGIPFPSGNTLSIGPVTAGFTSAELFLTSGNASGVLEFFDASGKSLGTNSFSCAPKYTSRLVGIPVTNETAPAISS